MAAALREHEAAGSPLRWLLLLPLAALLVILLILLMGWMIRAPEGDPNGRQQDESAQLVRVDPEQQKPQQDEAAAKLPELAPPPPPSAPPALARPALPSIAGGIPITVPQVEVANVGIGAANLAAGVGLGNSGTFGGFAGGGGNGNGNGGGGGGAGRGEGFSGKELVPLSTARPQMPDWACKQKIKGWVEVVFIVRADGGVENVRLVDAQPRGVYEAAAIESVSHWIYEKSKGAREVKQRVPMDPEDCAYNYNQ